MGNATIRRFPLRRAIAACVAVFFFGTAAYFFALSMMNRAHFTHEARFGVVVALSVDFSTPGTYTASFDHWPPVLSHAILGLDVPGRVLSETTPDVLLSGLQGTFEILDADGSKICSGLLIADPNMIATRYFQNVIELRTLGSWYGEVKWKINVTVTQGAPRLEGIPQRFVLIDVPIFREGLLPNSVLALLALLVGVVILIVVAVKSLHKKKLPEYSQQNAEPKSAK